MWGEGSVAGSTVRHRGSSRQAAPLTSPPTILFLVICSPPPPPTAIRAAAAYCCVSNNFTLSLARLCFTIYICLKMIWGDYLSHSLRQKPNGKWLLGFINGVIIRKASMQNMRVRKEKKLPNRFGYNKTRSIKACNTRRRGLIEGLAYWWCVIFAWICIKIKRIKIKTIQFTSSKPQLSSYFKLFPSPSPLNRSRRCC